MRYLRATGPRFVAVVFRLLLVASLWDGPVLWGHTHSPDSPDLAEHLARFHTCDAEATRCAWHWHVSLPLREGSESGDGQPSEPSQPTALLSASGLAGLAPSAHSEPAAFADGWLRSVASGHPGTTGWSVLQSERFHRAPPSWLCRLSC